MKKPFTNRILGVNIAVTNMREVVNLIVNNVTDLQGKFICLSNVHTTVMSEKDEEYRSIQNSAFLALPDGSPLALVQRLRGYRGAEQVAGPDLMPEIWKATEHTELSHYFYGSTQETIEALHKNLIRKYPELKIAGMEAPPFRPLTDEEDRETIERINASGADFVWVGLGAPKQEKWMYDHRERIHALMLGVGAGFDFHAGTVKRAPSWMREHYLEWLYRLIQDPKRLWKRYVQTNGKFLLLSVKDAFVWKKYKDADRKNLLIYAHYYYPDVASTGQILTELAEGLHVSMQSISRTLKSLENKGYIVREVDSDNRRNTLIKLSKKGNELVPAPQLRCPAEITYVFKNEPKVKEIVKTPFKLKKGETVKLTFEKLGISKNTDSFLMELEAKAEETSMLRYPYTLFHSTMPGKTAHMYGKIRIKEGK